MSINENPGEPEAVQRAEQPHVAKAETSHVDLVNIPATDFEKQDNVQGDNSDGRVEWTGRQILATLALSCLYVGTSGPLRLVQGFEQCICCVLRKLIIKGEHRFAIASLLRVWKSLVHHQRRRRIRDQILAARVIRSGLRCASSIQRIPARCLWTPIHLTHWRYSALRWTHNNRHRTYYGSGYRGYDHFWGGRRNRRADGVGGNLGAGPCEEERLVPWSDYRPRTALFAVCNLYHFTGIAFDLEMEHLDSTVWTPSFFVTPRRQCPDFHPSLVMRRLIFSLQHLERYCGRRNRTFLLPRVSGPWTADDSPGGLAANRLCRRIPLRRRSCVIVSTL